MYTRMAEAHRTCMRMRGNHGGAIYLSKIYAHGETVGEGRKTEKGKDIKTEIKRDEKVSKMMRGKMRRMRREG